MRMLMMVVLLSGCAQHGLMLQTDKEFKGELSVGWGPTAVIDGNMAGGMKVCVPSEEALKEDGQNNWCRSWMDKQ